MFKPVEKTHRKKLLLATVELVKQKKVAFTPTKNEYIWTAEEGDFKWTLSRSKDCKFCLAVYSNNRPPTFVRSSGGELQKHFYELLYQTRLHEEQVLAKDLLAELEQHFGEL